MHYGLMNDIAVMIDGLFGMSFFLREHDKLGSEKESQLIGRHLSGET